MCDPQREFIARPRSRAVAAKRDGISQAVDPGKEGPYPQNLAIPPVSPEIHIYPRPPDRNLVPLHSWQNRYRRHMWTAPLPISGERRGVAADISSVASLDGYPMKYPHSAGDEHDPLPLRAVPRSPGVGGGGLAGSAEGWFGWFNSKRDTPPGSRQRVHSGKVWPLEARPCGPNEPLVHQYHTSHYWPDPFRWKDREIVRGTIAAQRDNGWITRRRCTNSISTRKHKRSTMPGAGTCAGFCCILPPIAAWRGCKPGSTIRSARSVWPASRRRPRGSPDLSAPRSCCESVSRTVVTRRNWT